MPKIMDMHHGERLVAFANFAKSLAALSKCTDRGVAAIICDTKFSQIYSIGINGGPAGGRNCLCSLGGKYTCAHAEVNALIKCKTECRDKVMICTLSPCITCATLIVNSGFKTVYCLEAYKDDLGVSMMREAGISVFYLSADMTEVYR